MSTRVKVCVSICAARADEVDAGIARASVQGNLIELRLDCLSDAHRSAGVAAISEWSRKTKQMIVTLRAAEQGGHNQLSDDERRGFWSSLKNLGDNVLFDIELDLVEQLGTALDLNRVICSHHDLTTVPANLNEIYQRMAASGARVLKIAVQADDATDCLPTFRLLQRARVDRRELIGIAMGPAGIMTRILGPSRGSFLTYGSLDDNRATAPGQLTARELREVYRIDEIDRQTEILGIMGSPVSHSLSPHIQNAAFVAAGINAVYLPFELHDVHQFMRRMIHPRSRELDWNLRGLSVTAPHKMAVMDDLDWIDPAAKQIGAVNTVVVKGDELHGYNTDAPGFIRPLREKFGSLREVPCAIIGAGGSARSALWALRNDGAEVTLFVRDASKTRPLANQFNIDCRSLSGANFGNHAIVINATPLGTLGREQESPVTREQLAGVRLAYDLVYNPIETLFMRQADDAGCEVMSGLEMLIAQAILQFKLWTGRDPSGEVMRAAALHMLTK